MVQSSDTVAGSRYALYAAAFGAVFPVVGTLLEMGVLGLPLTPASVIAVQASRPLLWIIDAAPLVLGLFGIALDRRQRELDQLRALEAASRLAREIDRFLNLAEDPLAILARDRTFKRISPGVTNVLGYDAGHLDGVRISDLIHPDDLAGLSDPARPGVVDSLDGREVRVRTREGEYRWLRWSEVEVAEEGLTYALGRDRTEERIAHEQLTGALEAARSAARTKSEFLANMSHELRTPMNGVIGMTDLALETELDDEQRMFLESARESAQDLLGSLTDLLDFSQIETNRLALRRASFSPSATIAESVDYAKALAEAKGVAVLYEEGPGLSWDLVGDEARLSQVLSELVENAVKFTDHGEIVVRAECVVVDRREGWLRISVQDTGPGLDAEQRVRVFEAFAQADSSLTRVHGGTGLGLTIAAHLAEMMAGQITVDSAPGEGSTFHLSVRLPLASVTGPAIEVSSPVSPTGASARSVRRVLLAEDNRVNRLVTEAFLVRRGFEVEVAHDGVEAVEHVRDQPFDFILMDVQMPEMDGMEATHRIREMEKDRIRRTPIIALTAHMAKGDREACLRAGMDDYISKPVDPEHLEAVIQRQVYGPRPDFERSRALALVSGDEALLLATARQFVDTGADHVRVVLDALYRSDKIALWQAARAIEADANRLSLERLRDVSHRVAVLIARGRPDDALALMDELKVALRDALSAMQRVVDAA